MTVGADNRSRITDPLTHRPLNQYPYSRAICCRMWQVRMRLKNDFIWNQQPQCLPSRQITFFPLPETLALQMSMKRSWQHSKLCGCKAFVFQVSHCKAQDQGAPVKNLAHPCMAFLTRPRKPIEPRGGNSLGVLRGGIVVTWAAFSF